VTAARFPAEVERLFWDVDPDTVDVVAHRDYVLERVMTRGTWQAMLWLRRTYPLEELASFLERRGDRLPPRDLAYWSLLCGVRRPIPRGGGRPSWAGA
jgi:hypothetical protein